MSTEDPLGAKIRAKIQWHQSEVQRLQAIFDEFEAGEVHAPQRPLQPSKGINSSTPVKPPAPSAFISNVRRVMGEGEALNSREIADRLKAAGHASEAKDYYATVYNQLASWAAKGVGVVKVGDRKTGVLFRRK